MAVYDLEEQEKIDALRAWWKENARFVLLTAAACAVAIAAVNGWRWYQRTQAEEAAEIFKTISSLSGKENLSTIQGTSQRLRTEYAVTAYAARAALISAEESFKAGNLARARSELQWLIDQSSEPGLVDIARLRLAGVALDEKKPEDALQILSSRHGAAFDGLYLELTGDVLVTQGKINEARDAYNDAVKKTDGAYRAIIEAKRDSLGE